MKTRVMRLTLIWVSLTVISLMLTASSYARIDPKTCVGMWLFDEGTGKVVKDLSGNGNDGEIKGETKWVDGKFGKALQFDGKTGYVDIPSSKSLGFNKAITAEAWVKSNADHPNYTGLIRKGNHPTDRPNFFMLQIKPDGPGGADLIQLVYSHASNDNDYVDSLTSLDVGKWYHLAGVINPAGGKMTLYFNGNGF